MDKLILVYYIDTRNLPYDTISEYISKIMERIKLESPFIGEIIVLPVNSETRIECINPKYITENELIITHKLKMDKLHEILDNHIKSNDRKI